MKQAYFAAYDPATTGETEQNHLAVRGDIRACAASAGVDRKQLATLAPLVGYILPKDVEDDAPVSLALLNVPTGGRLLCHGGVAPARDGTPAHSFTHVLLDVPATLDAHQAIQTWGSDQWQHSAADGLGELDDLLFPPVSTVLDDAAFTRFLDDERHRELFQFVLASVLSTPAETTIFVAAPAQTVAACVYGVTRVMPSSLLDSISFSTYQHNPLTCPARIVGAMPDGPGRELPPNCYDGKGVGINTFTGTKTSVNTEIAFVEFAVQLATAGNWQPLDDFRNVWQRLGLKDAALLDVVYRLGRGPQAIARSEAVRALQDSSLAAWICPRAEFQQQFLTWALEDVEFATGAFPRVVAALKQKPEHLGKLAVEIHEAGMAAVPAGDLTRTRSALEVLLPMVAPSRAQGVWSELLQNMHDPEMLSWDMRAYLLPRLARLRPLAVGQAPEADLRRWVRVEASRLTPLLGLSLSQGYQVAACLELMKGGASDVAAVAHAVSGNPTMAMTLLQQLTSTEAGYDVASTFFTALVNEAPRPAWMEELLTLEPGVPSAFLDRALGTVLDAGAPVLNALPFVRQFGAQVLERLAGYANLDRLAAKALEGEAGERIGDPKVRDFFLGLEGKAGLSHVVEERVAAVLTIHRYFENPSVNRETLDRVAAAFAVPGLFADATQRKLLDTAVSQLRAASFQDDLIGLLLSWGSLFGGPSQLCREVLQRYQGDRAFWKQPDMLLAFLAVALDATPSEELNTQTEGLEAEAFAVVEGAVRRNGKKFWKVLDERTLSWPRSARRQWQFLSRAVMPEKGRGVARDVLLFFLGIAITAAVFAVLRWYQII